MTDSSVTIKLHVDSSWPASATESNVVLLKVRDEKGRKGKQLPKTQRSADAARHTAKT